MSECLKMDFEPLCAGMGIGGMPHLDPAKACEVILQYTPRAVTLPNCSNISYKQRSMFYSSEGLPGRVIDDLNKRLYLDSEKFFAELEVFYQHYLEEDIEYFATSTEFHIGYHVMLDILRKKFPDNTILLKGNIASPVSFCFRLKDEKGEPIYYNPHFRDAAVKLLGMKARWLETQLKKVIGPRNVSTLILFADPFLEVIGSAYYNLDKADIINILNECLDSVKGLSGIHCCGNTDWGMLLNTQIDVLSFDAYNYTEKIALYSQDIKNFLNRGGMLAWGIVPTSTEAVESENARSLVNKLIEGIKLLSNKGIDEVLLFRRSFITPSCGTTTLSEQIAERIHVLLKEVYELLMENYGHYLQ